MITVAKRSGQARSLEPQVTTETLLHSYGCGLSPLVLGLQLVQRPEERTQQHDGDRAVLGVALHRRRPVDCHVSAQLNRRIEEALAT